MALLGPNPNPASVASLIRNSKKDELPEVFEEVLNYTDGSVLTHLAANSLTRPKLVDFFTVDKLKQDLPLLEATSDPNFTALAILADEEETLRQPILDLVGQSRPEVLTIWSRLLAKSKLDVKKLSTDQLDFILAWTSDAKAAHDGAEAPRSSARQHWQMLATVLAKACVSVHKDYIVDYTTRHQNSDLGYAAIRATVDELPSLADLVWQSPPPTPLSLDYLRMLMILANSSTNRDRLRQHSELFAAITQAANDKNAIAAVVEAKVWAGVTSQTGNIEEAAERLNELSKTQFEVNVDEITLEGLACTVRLVDVRDRISHQKDSVVPKPPTATQAPPAVPVDLLSDAKISSKPKVAAPPTVIEGLAMLLKDPSGAMSYGSLAVLAQLARFPIKPTKDEERDREMRIKSVGKTVYDLELDIEIDNENDKFHVRQESGRICDQMLGAAIVPWLSQNITRLSTASHQQVANLLHELAMHQEHQRRQRLANQGAVVLGMFLWTTTKPSKLSPTYRAISAAIIAKILSSVPPQAALTERVTGSMIIEPLVCQIINEDSPRTNLDTLEALFALTNLASGKDDQLRLAIARRVWPRIIDTTNSEFLNIRRASLELICNLMMVAQSASHFLQHTPQSDDLLSLLGDNVICDDPGSRYAASGALAMLAEWETAPETIGRNQACVSGLSRALGLFMKDDALLIRVLAALKIVLKVTTSEMNDEVVESIVYNEGLAYLEQLVDTVDPITRGPVAKSILQCIKLIAEYKSKSG